MQKHPMAIDTSSDKRNMPCLSHNKKTEWDGVDDDQINAHQHFNDEIGVQLDWCRRHIEVGLAHTKPLVQQGLEEAAQTLAT
jgi:hypothetical protein